MTLMSGHKLVEIDANDYWVSTKKNSDCCRFLAVQNDLNWPKQPKNTWFDAADKVFVKSLVAKFSRKFGRKQFNTAVNR